jgi:protein-S-isoprenylcysteine O-methyltransferase Ste14
MTRLFAWAGGAAFLASLLWFLYCYIVDFDRRSPAPLVRGITIDVALFSLFAAHHSLLARSGVRRLVHQLVPAPPERSLYTWVASLLFIGVCALWRALPGSVYSLDGFWRAAAYLLQAAGIVLTIRASALLDVLDLAGVRPVLLAQSGKPARHVPLETRGLYGFVRHPLYFAWTLFVFATPDMTATRALFAVVSSGYLALAIPWEERSLVEVFGADYEAYRRKVRWRMVPGIY